MILLIVAACVYASMLSSVNLTKRVQVDRVVPPRQRNSSWRMPIGLGIDIMPSILKNIVRRFDFKQHSKRSGLVEEGMVLRQLWRSESDWTKC